MRYLSAVFLLLVAVHCAAAEIVSVFEQEPNNRPAEANMIAGEVTVIGSMAGSDQDAYLWTVSDVGARKRWTFALDGIPGALTIVQVFRLEYTEDGTGVAAKRTLMKMGSRDGLTPSVATDLLFEPGEYLIGVAHAGGGKREGDRGLLFRPPASSLSFGESDSQNTNESTDATATGADQSVAGEAHQADAGGYRFTIREGSQLVVRTERAPRLSVEDAQAVGPGREFATYQAQLSAWYSVRFEPEDTGQRWDIRLQAPVGRVLDAALYDQAGEKLLNGRTDDRGQLTFADIAPAAEPYAIELTSTEAGFLQVVSSVAVGARVAGGEAEPNDAWKLANRFDMTQPLTGGVTKQSEEDYFRFSVSEAASDQMLVVEVRSAVPGEQLDLCLLDSTGRRLQCRRGVTPMRLSGLVLQPGDWGVRISRAVPGMEYELSVSGQGPIEPGVEAEPNDTVAQATAVPAKNRIKGSFSQDDADVFRFIITDEAQLWRFQVIGDGLTQVAYLDGAGHRIQSIDARGARRARLDNLFLMPGKHHLKISGKAGGSYTVLGRALGPPDADGEWEPNDDESRMQRLAMGQTRTGLLAEKSDKDNYRFFLANHDHIRLALQPPADGGLKAQLYWQGAALVRSGAGVPGEALELSGVFPPGDYRVELAPTQTSEAEYQISLTRLPRYSCPVDCEPNGYQAMHNAAALPKHGVIEGRSGDWGKVDAYQLPVQSQPVDLVIRSAETVRLSLGENRYSNRSLSYDAASGTYSASLLPDVAYQLIVESRGADYRLAVEINGEPGREIAPLAAEMEMTLDDESVAAYSNRGQRVGGRLSISNASDAPLVLTVDATTSDYRWRVELDRAQIEVAPGSQTNVPLEVLVPRDAWADRPVRISARVRDGEGAQVETWRRIGVERYRVPVEPTLGWSMPDSLLGGFNVAWAPLGSRWVGSSHSGTGNYEYLFNDLVYGHNMNCCPTRKGTPPPALTIELPGDEPVPVAGVALNHFASSDDPWSRIREATLLLSDDGEAFREVLSFATEPVDIEQYFAMSEPQLARFAQLRVDRTFHVRSGSSGVILGEWKVIAAPGFDISAGVGFNLADRRFGGHVVSHKPPSPQRGYGILNDESPDASLNYVGPGAVEYVIGFHHERAAQIERMDWIYTDRVKPAQRFGKVSVAVSTESPLGPWLPIGEMVMGDPQAPESLQLDSPVWARFVRFLTSRPEGAPVMYRPKAIRIWERPSGDGYRSVLAEWGNANRLGEYERQQGLPPEPEMTIADNTTRSRAALLSTDQLAAGQAALARQERWYSLQIPAEDNVLTLELTGDPTVRTVIELESEDGVTIPLRKLERQSTPVEHVLEATVAPEDTVYVHVVEPPRNVMFTWDTSASMGAYLPTVYNSLNAFASEVTPGKEAVNLLPFSDLSPLLRDWYGEPYVLQTILNDYPRRKSSSSGETALRRSAEALAPLAGSKAILVITDGRVVHDGKLWEEMRAVQPRIFGVHVGGLEPYNQDLFQDWASINGGDYRYLVYDGEMEIAFDRAATLLRRPADFTLLARTSYTEAPGPGMLTLVSGEAMTATGSAVELILDASGSMLQRLEGRRRIDIAKAVLTEAVTEHIPVGTPVALRVFGHKEPDACRTDLEMALAPLDPEAAAGIIGGVQAMNLARTPIADSLKAVRGDLEGRDGRIAIVLVTDGEETCDGDPAEAIAALQAQGIEVNLNIVGFAIDDPDLAEQFAGWAEQGNGRYFSASNQEGLSEAIEEALRVSYQVYDSGGEWVAEGLVDGEPEELVPGIYRITVQGGAAKTFERIEIIGGATTELGVE